MSSTLIALMTPNPDEPEALAAYGDKVPGILKQNGGKPTDKKVVTEHIAGSKAPKVITTIEFPTSEALHNFLNSNEYQAMIPVRDKAFTDATLVICE